MYDVDAAENEELAIRRRIKTAMLAYRTAQDWTQLEMAKFLQVTRRNYEAYEGKEDRGVPVSVIARFCKFTHTDTNLILFGKRLSAKAG